MKDLGQISLFYVWTSNVLAPFVEDTFSQLYVFAEFLCTHVWILDFVTVTVFVPVPYCFYYYFSVIYFEICNGNPYITVIFSLDGFGYPGSLVASYEFLCSLLSFLSRIAVDL